MSFEALVASMDLAVLRHLGGVATSYAPTVGPAVSVEGMFDRNYARTQAGEAGIESYGPAVFYRLADLPSDPETDSPTITILGTIYEAAEVRKDSKGGVLIHLAKKP